jgi:hypothetical protein
MIGCSVHYKYLRQAENWKEDDRNQTVCITELEQTRPDHLKDENNVGHTAVGGSHSESRSWQRLSYRMCVSPVPVPKVP